MLISQIYRFVKCLFSREFEIPKKFINLTNSYFLFFSNIYYFETELILFTRNAFHYYNLYGKWNPNPNFQAKSCHEKLKKLQNLRGT